MIQICENLWSDWKHNHPASKKSGFSPSDIFSGPSHAYLKQYFCLDALPEPYLLFGNLAEKTCNSDLGQCNPKLQDVGSDNILKEVELVFLTTNPGYDWSALQGYNAIQSSSSLAGIQFSDDYQSIARNLARFYAGNLSGSSLRRIEAMRYLASNKPFMQVEAIPFHSARFPNKTKYLNAIITQYKTNSACPLLWDYSSGIEKYLNKRNVVSIQAVGRNDSLDDGNSVIALLKNKPWLAYIYSLMGLALSAKNLKWVPITKTSRGSVSSGCLFYTDSTRMTKCIFLMKGGNNFPSIERMKNENIRDSLFGKPQNQPDDTEHDPFKDKI